MDRGCWHLGREFMLHVVLFAQHLNFKPLGFFEKDFGEFTLESL
jgi:hypothetical protein